MSFEAVVWQNGQGAFQAATASEMVIRLTISAPANWLHRGAIRRAS